VGVTLGGVQSFDYRGARADSRCGDVIVLYPDELHDGRAGAETGFHYRMLYVEPRLLRDALGDRATGLPFIGTAVSDDPRLAGAVRLGLDQLDHGLEALEADQIVLALAEALLALAPSVRGRPGGTTSAIAVERARQFLDAHFARTVASEELEAVAGIDRFTLARHFRIRLGTSPYRYLTMRRLDAARRRMCAGHSLVDSALASGFADQSHMTRHFKRAYGLSPGRWRALHVGTATTEGIRRGRGRSR